MRLIKVDKLENKEPKKGKISHYLSASVLTTFAGLVSFPVLTRFLSKSDYGIYSTIQGIQLLYEAVLKGGFQFSLKRYYPISFLSANHNNRVIFLSTLVVFPMILTSLLSLIITTLCLLLYFIWDIGELWYLLIIITAQCSCYISYFRAYSQASGLSKVDAMTDIFHKYLYLILVIPIVVYFMGNFIGVYLSVMLSTLASTIFLIYLNRHIFSFFSFNIDFKLLKNTFIYSTPLMLMEISSLSISYIDRIIMGSLDVDMSNIGIYSIGFGLANIIFILLWKVLHPTILPAVNSKHDLVGPHSSIQKLREVSNILIMFFIMMSVAIVLNASDFIVILCGEDKKDAFSVFIFATILYFIRIISIFIFYGYELIKNTKLVFYSELIIAFSNIILNLILIPEYDMYGALMASYISIFIGIIFKLYNLPNDYRVGVDLSGIVNVILMACSYTVLYFLIFFNIEFNPLFRMLLSGLIFILINLVFYQYWKKSFSHVFREFR